jgi:hypothetical protein
MTDAIRTPDDAWAAGAAAATGTPPLDDAQVTAIAVLLAPHRAPGDKAA